MNVVAIDAYQDYLMNNNNLLFLPLLDTFVKNFESCKDDLRMDFFQALPAFLEFYSLLQIFINIHQIEEAQREVYFQQFSSEHGLEVEKIKEISKIFAFYLKIPLDQQQMLPISIVDG